MTEAPAKPAPSKIIPNTFQTPNLLTDEGLLALLTGSETKCYLVIIRKTFGWRKDRDRIAKSQIAAATGLSEGAVDDCMVLLVKFGLVIRTAENNPANEGVEWAPQMDESLINIEALQERQNKARSANSKRTEKARLARGGDVQQPHHVQQSQGGDVQHPPQQPITAIKDIVVVFNAGSVFQNYESEIGLLTPAIRDSINGWIDEEKVPLEWLVDAMHEAARQNKRNWSYCEGILKNWKNNGRGAPRPQPKEQVKVAQTKRSQSKAPSTNADVIRKVAQNA